MSISVAVLSYKRFENYKKKWKVMTKGSKKLYEAASSITQY